MLKIGLLTEGSVELQTNQHKKLYWWCWD